MKMEKIKTSLIALAKSIGSSALTAFLVWCSQLTAGCTSIVIPTDDAGGTVSITGALPVGIQLNTKSTNN